MLFGLPHDSLFFSVWLTEKKSHPFFMLFPYHVPDLWRMRQEKSPSI